MDFVDLYDEKIYFSRKIGRLEVILKDCFNPHYKHFGFGFERDKNDGNILVEVFFWNFELVILHD